MTLSGKVALVTGGARRIGRAIALNLAEAGCDVALHYRHAATAANDTAAAIRSRGRRVELFPWDFSTQPDASGLVRAVTEKMGRLDILVNNASYFEPEGNPTDQGFRADFWEQMFRVNVVAPAALCHAAGGVMRGLGGGRIVNLCDICWERPWINHLAYCASKAALVCLTRGLALALAPAIQVNGVSPGIAEFPDAYSPATQEDLIRKVPLARAGTAEEVALAVRFLIEGPGYVTGQILSVDGGRSLR